MRLLARITGDIIRRNDAFFAAVWHSLVTPTRLAWAKWM
jgi:hypothetical protein